MLVLVSEITHGIFLNDITDNDNAKDSFENFPIFLLIRENTWKRK